MQVFDFNFGFELQMWAFITLCVNTGIARGWQVVQVQSKGQQKLTLYKKLIFWF